MKDLFATMWNPGLYGLVQGFLAGLLTGLIIGALVL